MSGTIQRKVGIESMVNNNNDDIDALLRALDPKRFPVGIIHFADLTRHHAALTALVAERDALKAQCDKRFDFATIKAHIAEQNALKQRVEELIAERNALKQRVAELEAHPPADRELREQLVESALRGVNVSGLHRSEAELIGTASVWMVDAAIAAMRKGDSDGK